MASFGSADNQLHFYNKTSEKFYVLVVPDLTWALVDLGLSVASISSAASSLANVGKAIGAIKAASGMAKMLKIVSTLAYAAKNAYTLASAQETLKAKSSTVDSAQTVNTTDLRNALNEDISNIRKTLEPLKNMGWVIASGKGVRVHEESLQNPLQYLTASGWASMLGLSDVMLIVFNESFTKTATFGTNSDHSWIATENGVVRQKYGAALDVEDPNAGWRPYDSEPVVLYQNQGFGGQGWSFGLGRWDLRKENADNTITSIVVAEGFRAKLYDNIFSGESRQFNAGRHHVGDFNDKGSSLIVEKVSASIFSGVAFSGRCKGLEQGSYTVSPADFYYHKTMTARSDIYLGGGVSSVMVSPGYQVTLYENVDFSGRETVVTEDAICLGDGVDDSVKSVIVEDMTAPVVLYEHSNKTGRRIRLHLGRHDASKFVTMNDQVTRVTVPKGYRVTVFEHGGFTGRFRSCTKSTTFAAGDSFNDSTSSVIVEKLDAFGTVSPVVLFQHSNWRGACRRLEVGSYDLHQMGISNDRVSSLRVAPGYEVTLYQHSGFRGTAQTYAQDSSYVGDRMNDETSSVVVRKIAAGNPPMRSPVVLYSDENFGGDSQAFSAGSWNIDKLFLGNDRVSSLRVYPGWSVTLYQHRDFGGAKRTFTGDASFVGSRFNDICSSLKVKLNS